MGQQSIGASDKTGNSRTQNFLEIFETFSHDEISLFEKNDTNHFKSRL
jgi:hypothetical protein